MAKYYKDEDVFAEVNRFNGYLDDDMILRINTAIKRLPSKDIEKVINCKDCYWYSGECGGPTHCMRFWDELKSIIYVDDNDFCSSARPIE